MKQKSEIRNPKLTVMRIVTKAFLRYLPRRRGLSGLQLMGIACGVAATVGMVFSARAALSSFAEAVDFLRGRATHSLERPAGPMDEGLLVQLVRDPSVQAFSPVIDRRIFLENGEMVRILGVDPFLDRTIRPELSSSRPGERPDARREEILSFLMEEDAVLVDEGLVGRLGLGHGSTVETSHGRVRIVGTFANPMGEPLMLMDIAHAQAMFELTGRVDRVDLILADVSGFQARWGKGFSVQSSVQRQASFGDMLRAFRLNLEALSLLALFVGVFLVYNTAMFAVVTRRRDAGILRSMGARRHEIVLAFLAEILLLGGLGGVLGGILGYGLSLLLADLLGNTISRLYSFVGSGIPPWSWWIPVYGGILGCAASLLGGAFPLAELVRVDPVKALQGRVGGGQGKRRARETALVGLAMLVVSLTLLPAASQHVYVGFAAAFGLLMGASLLTGVVLIACGPALKGLLARLGGLPGKVAAGNVSRNLGRTAVAIAAFMVALSMSIGLGSMIGSFRHTLVWWMNSQLRGDLYIAPTREFEVPLDLYEELRSMAGIGGLDPYRNVPIHYQGTTVFITAIDASVLQRYTRFGWVRGGNENWDPVQRGAVIISESFARRFSVASGETITLEGVKGPVPLEVAALFYDYTTEHGLIMMDRSTYLRLYEDPTVDSLVVFMDKDEPGRQEILEEVRRKAQARGVPVATQRQFHDSILNLFDTTFAVTRSMRILAVVVAFFGIAGALLTLFMERQRDFGIYRALGFSTGQVAGMTLLEGLGMGLVSFVLSTGVGTALAWVLIHVINLRSFNWTVFFHFEWWPYLLTGGTAILASLGAAIYPIWRVCRTYPQMQIREE